MEKELKITGEYRAIIQDIICSSLVGKSIRSVSSTIGSSFIVEIGEVYICKHTIQEPEWLIHNFGCEWELRDKSNKKLMDWSEGNSLDSSGIVFSDEVVTAASFKKDKFLIETSKYIFDIRTIDDFEDVCEEEGGFPNFCIEYQRAWSCEILENNDMILSVASEEYRNKGMVI